MVRQSSWIALVCVLLLVCMALTAALLLRGFMPAGGRRIMTAGGTYFLTPGEAPLTLTNLTDDKRLFSGLRAGE